MAAAIVPLARRKGRLANQRHFVVRRDEATDTWAVFDSTSDEIGVVISPPAGEFWEVEFDTRNHAYLQSENDKTWCGFSLLLFWHCCISGCETLIVCVAVGGGP